MRAWAILAGAMVALSAPVAAQSVEAGIAAWQRGDYEQAVSVWRPLAQQGDADAAFNIGQAYRLGRGVPLDLAQAQSWFERAARKGHVDAQTTLGLLLFDNGNRTSGLRWLRQAAEHGDPRAQLVYGTALYNGDGVPRDLVRAYAFVSKAAAQGLAPAKKTLQAMDSVLTAEQRKRGAALAAGAADPPTKKAAATSVASAPKPAAPEKAGKGSWRIQLGAFSKSSSAASLWERLSAKPALAGKTHVLVPGSSVTRLQAGPFTSRAAAEKACAELKAGGQACFTVDPD